MSLYVGKEMVTRGGLKARVICVDKRSNLNKYPVIALVSAATGNEASYSYTEEGRYLYPDERGETPNHPLDLLEPVVENALYRVIYDTGVIGKSNFLSERDARAHVGVKSVLKLVFSGPEGAREFIRAELL